MLGSGERAWSAHADETGTFVPAHLPRLLLQGTLKDVSKVLHFHHICWKCWPRAPPVPRACPDLVCPRVTVVLHQLISSGRAALQDTLPTAMQTASGCARCAARHTRGSTAWPCRSRWRRATWARCARCWPCWPQTAPCAWTASCSTTWRAWTPASPVRAGRAAACRSPPRRHAT